VAPITRAGLGWLLIVFDLRLGGYDVVVDAAGWALVLLAMLDMRRRGDWFRWAVAMSAVALWFSLIEYAPDVAGGEVATWVYNLLFTPRSSVRPAV